MSAVPVAREQVPLVASAASDVGALVQFITQAARDQNIDITKMERLMSMYERLTAREAEKAFNVAMTACQSELRQVSTDATNPQTRSNYATYAKLDSVLRPIYTKHGFALSFDEGESKPEMVRVVCIVSHVGGHSRSYHRDIPADGKGAKGGDVMTKTHAAGAAGSYGARYLLKGIFNVAIGEYDNDGNTGGLGEDAIAAHLAKIDSAADEAALKDAFYTACKDAKAAGDQYAIKKFGEHKDARKKVLPPK